MYISGCCRFFSLAGAMYHVGRPGQVSVDPITSVEWLIRAERVGDVRAKQLLPEILGQEVHECV